MTTFKTTLHALAVAGGLTAATLGLGAARKSKLPKPAVIRGDHVAHAFTGISPITLENT